jgi:SP family arabinose:H+ symporter-like MFS transporter
LSQNQVLIPTKGESTAQGSNLYLYGAVLVACTCGFIFGFASFVISGVIIFLTKEFTLTPSEVGFAIGSMMIGSLFGSMIAGAISDYLGRKKAMILAALLWGASALGTALAQSMTQIYLFRICGGVGIAIAMLVSPIYIAEISPARLRGRLSTANQFIIISGALLAFIICYAFSFSGSWRWPLALGLIPALLLLIGLLFAPESPRWLVERKRWEEALTILTKINGPVEAEISLKDIMASQSAEGGGSFAELFRPGIRTALIVGIGIAAFQQLTGAGMVAFYAPVIFQKAGITSTSAAIGLSGFVFVSNLFCVSLAYVLVDRVGRRPLLLWGSIGMGFGLVLLTLILNYNWPAYWAVVAVVLIQAICNVSWGPLGWVVLGEIFPTHVRAKAMAVATFFLWITMFASVQFVPSLVAYFTAKYGSGGPTFLIFAVVCIFAYIFVWRMLPETKGKTLEEIAASWSAPKG